MPNIEISIYDILGYLGERSRPLKEGEEVFKAGHVILCGLDALDIKKITALCLQTSSLTSGPHKITIELSHNTKDWKCICTCKAGMSGACKHIVAALIYIEDILSLAKENPKCVPHLEALRKKIEKCFRLHGKAATRREKEPFATVTHNDLWVNNLMIKLGENGNPIRNKIVDYQFINYGSPGKDLIFFIFDSVRNEIIQTKYNEMIDLYHKTFTKALHQLHVETDEFSWENFLEELDHAADNTFVICQCFVMLRPIFAVKELVTDVENLRTDNILQYKGASVEHKEKLHYLVQEFAKRRWL